MAVSIDEFPHHGDHLASDKLQAEWTMALLAAFIIATALLFIVAFM
ncbi:MAG: hypothetical protein ACM31C_30975 [Acidobacteriota bacterium]